MLTRGGRQKLKAPGGFLFLALLALLFVAAPGSQVHADGASHEYNEDSSATVSWVMHNATGLTAQDITFSGGSALLPWQTNLTEWDRPSRFVENGTLDASVTASGPGLSLRPDPTNYVADGDFGTAASWSYQDGATGNVTARWNSTSGLAAMGHVATETSWENMDSVANWTYTSGITGFEETGGQREGAGMMGLLVAGWSNGFGGASRSSGPANWSGSDRLLVWVEMNNSLTVHFNITANIGSASGPLRGTAPLALDVGWQRLIIDLNQLGPASSRGGLYNVMLRFNAGSVALGTWFFVDDLRLGTAEFFNETASVSQSLAKANVTSAAPGSGLLSFDWYVPGVAGIVAHEAVVNLSGPSGSSESPIPLIQFGQWQTYSADVSSTTAAPGSYTPTFRLRAEVDNATAVDARLWIDNVTLRFPDRHNGTYTSRAISLLSRSAFLNVTWTADVPVATTLTLRLRTGNNSVPGSAGWGSWSSWSASGRYDPNLDPNPFFQVRAEFGTTNASETPTLTSLILEARHRVVTGLIVSDLYTVPSPQGILHWRRFDAAFNATPSSSISYSVNDSSERYAVVSGSDLSGMHGRSIRWEARFTTSDGLVTPSLSLVTLTYEYLGPIQSVVVSPSGVINATSGDRLHLRATARDAGGHVLPTVNFTWSTTAPGGLEYDNDNATFVAGAVGLYRVVAAVQGLGNSGSVWVNVSAAPEQTSFGDVLWSWPLWPYFLAILGAAGTGFVGYEVWARRVFAIDDVFLIKKDGRLIMHNTRRMRADRDEDILSGMLTAILAFIRDSDPEENGELKRFEIGGKTTLLERGEHVYLTAVYSGRVPRWAVGDLRRFVRDLEAKFGNAFATWDGSPEDLQGVKAYVDRLATRARYRRPPPRNASAG